MPRIQEAKKFTNQKKNVELDESDLNSQREAEKKKSNAEKCKEYRERQKIKQLSTVNLTPDEIKISALKKIDRKVKNAKTQMTRRKQRKLIKNFDSESSLVYHDSLPESLSNRETAGCSTQQSIIHVEQSSAVAPEKVRTMDHPERLTPVQQPQMY